MTDDLARTLCPEYERADDRAKMTAMQRGMLPKEDCIALCEKAVSKAKEPVFTTTTMTVDKLLWLEELKKQDFWTLGANNVQLLISTIEELNKEALELKRLARLMAAELVQIGIADMQNDEAKSRLETVMKSIQDLRDHSWNYGGFGRNGG